MIVAKTKLNLYAQKKISKPIIKLLLIGMIYAANALIGQNNQTGGNHMIQENEIPKYLKPTESCNSKGE